LITEGSKHLPTETIRENLDWFKRLEGKKFSDDEYYRIIVDVIFYAGFRAATVNSKIEIIHVTTQPFLAKNTICGKKTMIPAILTIYSGATCGEISFG